MGIEEKVAQNVTKTIYNTLVKRYRDWTTINNHVSMK